MSVSSTENRVQIDIPIEFRRLFDDDWDEAAVYGGRNSLKSHTVARVLLIKAMQKKIRIGCFRELQNSIGDSSHQLLSDLILQFNLPFEVTNNSIICTETGSDFLFKGVKHNSQSIKSMEGIDIAWVEEASTVSKQSIDILVPTIRKKGSKIIWTYNRLFELDPIHKRLVLDKYPNTLVIKVDYTLAEKYGWLDEKTRIQIEEDKANDPAIYAHKWLGEPLSETDNAILDRVRVLEAMQRDGNDDGQVIIGVDVARMGGDRSVFWKRKGLKTLKVEVNQKTRIDELADKLEVFANSKKVEIKIDDTGVGGGLTDLMKRRGYNVIPINFGAAASDKDKYPNLISEAWFNLRDVIDGATLPMDNDLLMELTTRKWQMDSKGRRGVESKQDYKKRGYRSPDLADACIICYYTPADSGVEWLSAEDLL